MLTEASKQYEFANVSEAQLGDHYNINNKKAIK